MVACELGDVHTAIKLVEAGCDVRKTDSAARTGLERAKKHGHHQMFATLERSLDEAALQSVRSGIQWEQERPDVPDRIREDTDLTGGFGRLIFWALEIVDAAAQSRYSTWKYLAEGTFGKVFLVTDVYPMIQLNGERLDRASSSSRRLAPLTS